MSIICTLARQPGVAAQVRATPSRWLWMAAAAGLLAVVAACDSVPDTVNPFAEETPAGDASAIDAEAVPGAEQPFPNLADIPDRPQYRLTEEQRQGLIEGLVADREHARHSAPPAAPDAGGGLLMSAQPREKVEAIGGEEQAAAGDNKIATIGFTAGSTALPTQALDVLAKVAEVQKARRVNLRVVGHASDAGSSGPGPAEVSAERARLVAEELVRLGVDRADIVLDAMGERQPIPDDAPDANAGSDRVEIYLET